MQPVKQVKKAAFLWHIHMSSLLALPTAVFRHFSCFQTSPTWLESVSAAPWAVSRPCPPVLVPITMSARFSCGPGETRYRCTTFAREECQSMPSGTNAGVCS